MKRFATVRSSGRRSESWQVIYMDLMTIIMVFFVILWSINQRAEVGISESVGDETVKMVSLPGDVLFSSGESNVTHKGAAVFRKLFSDETGTVLNFDTGGLVKRQLVIHGHTDGDGEKDENFDLAYQRAFATYREIAKYGKELPDHVILCSHADNSQAQEVPVFQGEMSTVERIAVRDAKAKNRRIMIEDKMVSRHTADSP